MALGVACDQKEQLCPRLSPSLIQGFVGDETWSSAFHLIWNISEEMHVLLSSVQSVVVSVAPASCQTLPLLNPASLWSLTEVIAESTAHISTTVSVSWGTWSLFAFTCWRRSWRRCDLQLTLELDLGIRGSSPPLSLLGTYTPHIISTLEAASMTQPWEMQPWLFRPC